MNKGTVCVSVCAETADEMIANIKRAEEFADLIEVRFDCLKPAQVRGAFQMIDSTRPLLATFRSPDQGGNNVISLDERRSFWKNEPAQYWAADVEEDVVSAAAGWARRIVSFHDFDASSPNLTQAVDRLFANDAEAVKIAVATNDICDSLPVWALLEKAKGAAKQVIPIAMGDAGKWTRILGLAHGAFMTYASLDAGKETADGQITARDMIEVYRVKEFEQDTRVFGIVGDPVSSSLSPYMQNPAFVDGGVNAVFIPLLVKDLDEFIRRMVRFETREVELNFGGFSVTMPHKQSIIKHLDEIDPVAEKIGAVNTVKIDDGKLIGHNTDAHGFITPLKQKFGDLKDARVAVGGAGGGARACAYALKQEGAIVTVYARDQNKAAAFAEEFGVSVGVPDDSFKTGTIDILVNATPLGMKGGETEATIATAGQLDGIKLVYDLVYNPTETRLIREARNAGVPTLGGIEMLVTQGARQFEIWTGREAPIKLMRTSVLKRINDGR